MTHVLQVWFRQHAAAYSGDHAGRPYELTLLVTTVHLLALQSLQSVYTTLGEMTDADKVMNPQDHAQHTDSYIWI